MPDYLPLPMSRGSSMPTDRRRSRASRQAEVEVFEHGLRSAVVSAKEQIDSIALNDAITGAAEEEIRFLDYGLDLAKGNMAKAEIVARKLELLVAINNRRIAGRFRP